MSHQEIDPILGLLVSNVIPSRPKIRFVDTPNIRNARLVLNEMVKSLPLDSELRSFLLDKGNWLLLPLPEFTSVDATDIDSIVTLNSKEFNASVPFSDINKVKGIVNYKSGVYCIINTHTGEHYIGSAIDLYKRAKLHYNHSSSRASTPLYVAANSVTPQWNGFTWNWVVSTTNYRALFLDYSKSVSQEDLYILQSFSQFEARVFEQAMLSHYLPKLNGGHIVVFPFMNWMPGQVENASNPRVSIIATSADSKEEYYFTSKNEAATVLGIPRVQLDRYLNLVDYPVNNSVVGPVYLVDPSKPMLDGKPKASIPSNTFDTVTGIALEQLSPGKLYGYLEDKTTLFGEWVSPGEAAMELDGKRDVKYIKRYINLERPVLVGPNKVPVFFVMNPTYMLDSSARQGNRSILLRLPKYILEDTLLGVQTQHTTYQNIMDYIGKKSL